MSARYKPNAPWGIVAAMVVVILCGIAPTSFAEETDFLKRQKEVKERFEKRRERPMNPLVHAPPMVSASESSLGKDEPVIGVYRNGEARAYPLAMLYGGGAIFELLNDTCGGDPIAASW